MIALATLSLIAFLYLVSPKANLVDATTELESTEHNENVGVVHQESSLSTHCRYQPGSVPIRNLNHSVTDSDATTEFSSPIERKSKSETSDTDQQSTEKDERIELSFAEETQ